MLPTEHGPLPASIIRIKASEIMCGDCLMSPHFKPARVGFREITDTGFRFWDEHAHGHDYTPDEIVQVVRLDGLRFQAWPTDATCRAWLDSAAEHFAAHHSADLN